MKQLMEDQLSEEAVRRFNEDQQAEQARFHEAMVRKVEHEASLAKQARLEKEKLHDMDVAGQSSSFPPPPIPSDDVSGEPKEPASPSSMAIYTPGRRKKRMSHRRGLSIMRSARLSKKKGSTKRRISSKKLDLDAADDYFIKMVSSVDFPDGSINVLV